MLTNYENKSISVKLNSNLRGLKTGTVVKVKVDKDGTPKERYWRDRMKDAKTDNCIEIIKKKKQKSKED